MGKWGERWTPEQIQEDRRLQHLRDRYRDARWPGSGLHIVTRIGKTAAHPPIAGEANAQDRPTAAALVAGNGCDTVSSPPQTSVRGPWGDMYNAMEADQRAKPKAGADANSAKSAAGGAASRPSPPIPTLTEAVRPRDAVGKYRNQRTGRYASKREAMRATVLHLREKAGEITDLEEQVSYLLIPKQPGERACYYIADFRYRDRAGNVHIEDVKSDPTKTPAYRIKKKLLLFVHGLRIEEIR